MKPAYMYNATITHIVDGDTIDVAVDVGFYVTANVRLRLYGIDTPERGQAGYHEATEAVKRMLPIGSQVVVSTFKEPEKYGRFLAVISYGTKDVAWHLVQMGLAKTYFGGTKGVVATDAPTTT